MLKKLFFASLTLGMVYSCQNVDTPNDDDVIDLGTEEGDITSEPENDAPESYEKGGLKIYPKGEVAEFETAALELKNPKDGDMIKGKTLSFDFGVTNYQLGTQTEAARMGLANSDKGQHIHLIIDNNPYSAHYEPTFTKEVEPGHHYAIAFLSRSYHESVKNGNSAVVWQFTVGAEDEANTQKMDMDKPMLFYSRPKGEYRGADAKKVLFDFYLKNAELKADGYSVITTINDSLKFEFDTWQPYIIEGLPMGENTIKIELVDAQGRLADSEVNSVTRKFMLSE